MDAKLFTDVEVERRSAERTPACLESVMRDGAATAVAVVIHDISATGFLLSTRADLGLGMVIGLGLPGVGIVRAFLIRRERELVGGKFVTPITPAEVRTAIRDDPVVWASFPTFQRPGAMLPWETEHGAAPSFRHPASTLVID